MCVCVCARARAPHAFRLRRVNAFGGGCVRVHACVCVHTHVHALVHMCSNLSLGTAPARSLPRPPRPAALLSVIEPVRVISTQVSSRMASISEYSFRLNPRRKACRLDRASVQRAVASPLAAAARWVARTGSSPSLSAPSSSSSSSPAFLRPRLPAFLALGASGLPLGSDEGAAARLRACIRPENVKGSKRDEACMVIEGTHGCAQHGRMLWTRARPPTDRRALEPQ